MLSPQQIDDRLAEAARDDQLRSLGGIPQALEKQGRIEWVSRGRWAIGDGI